MREGINVDDLMYNCMVLLEVILIDKEVVPDIVLCKYGLLKLSNRDIWRLDAMEMLRLHRDGQMLKDIGTRFNMCDSEVYRSIKRWI